MPTHQAHTPDDPQPRPPAGRLMRPAAPNPDGDEPASALFVVGQRVGHAAFPQWGEGEVLRAERITVDGRQAQRLTIRFQRAGTRTISTAHAQLRSVQSRAAGAPAGADPSVPTGTAQRSEAPATGPTIPEGLDEPEARAWMTRLPATVEDRSVAWPERFAACVACFRLDASAQGLLDWAAVQSGLTDPLARFDRERLLEYFERYRLNREQSLRLLWHACRPEHVRERQRVLEAQRPFVQERVRACVARPGR